ncbi:MAG: DUF4493 domain-containing protein [Muribaculaceae bacterium]|nr:DUF4493 domain-containing protein [Muribaculaceae bacterium]MDE6094183.1 DUF4493 domain-containing protein [Muribaculaceae bacterium]
MKMINKYIIAFATALTVMAATTSCSSDEPISDSEKTYGTLSTKSLSIDVSEIADAMSRNTGDVLMTVEILQGNDTITKYAYENLPEVVRLPVGDYTIEVHSRNTLESAAFNAPYYKGIQNFTIRENLITEVDPVICRLINTKVSIVIDDYLEQQTEGDWDVRIVADENGKSLDFRGHKLDESENAPSAGYFLVTQGNTLTATFTGTVSGNKIVMTKTVTVENPGKEHHIFTFSIKTADGR